MSYRRLRWPLVALLILAAIWGGGWYYATGQLIATIRDGRPDPAQGMAVSIGTYQRGGFPFLIAAELGGLAARGPSWRADSPALRVVLKPWQLDRITVHLPEPVRFVTDAGPALALRFTDGQVLLRHGADGRAVTLSAAALVTEAGQSADRLDPGPTSGPLRIDLTQALPPPDSDKAALGTLTLDIAQLVVPRFALPGPHLDAGLSLSLSGPAPGGTPRAMVEAWRTGGGTVTMSRLSLVSGPSAARANATFSVDAALRPIGAGTVILSGYGDALALAQKTGKLRAGDAIAARLMLQGLAQPDGTITLPLTLQDGWMKAGPFPLLPLAPLPLGD